MRGAGGRLGEAEMTTPLKIGMIVPSSNTTMETEVPEILRRRLELSPETFTFHSSRVRMQHVTADELAAMVRDSDRCAVELADARVDAVAYACLVAIMAQGRGYHRESEARLAAITAQQVARAVVVSSAGALVRGLEALGARKVAMITPYMKPLTEQVADYIQDAGVEVVDAISLQISDNVQVAAHDPMRLPEIATRLQLADADAVILSACVQMRSLPAIPAAEARLGIPVLSASVATAYDLLAQLGLAPVAPLAGELLSGSLTATA